jgi:tRNA dimethylallyltransferase
MKEKRDGSWEKPMITILGPTASGKSTLAIQTAQILDGEIVNCDALQLHRFLNIGTAKPSVDEIKQIPHHLYDIIDPDEYFSAGSYMLASRRVCNEIVDRGKIPLVVGGTGLYLRALLEGVFAGPGRLDVLRERLHRIGRQKGTDYLHRLLKKKDPGACETIGRGDRIRLIRALEIYFATGRRISELQPQRVTLKGFSVLKIGLNIPRSILYDRINRRVIEMFDSGLIEETKELLDRGYSPDCKGFEALGYRHALAVLKREMNTGRAVELTQRDTRRYAKRQMTWFRKETEVHWISVPGEDPLALEQLLQATQECFEGN